MEEREILDQLKRSFNRRDFIKVAGAAAGTLALGSLPGCGPSAAPSTAGSIAGFRVGLTEWVQAAVHTDVWTGVRLWQTTHTTGVDANPILDGKGDGVKQVTDAEAFLTQNFKGVCILNIQPNGWDDWGARAAAKGIKTITVTSYFPSTTEFIQVDNVSAGFGLAQKAADWFNANHGGQGEWGLLTLTSIPALAARTKAMEVKMAQLLPNVKLVGKVEAADTQPGANAASSLLAAHPKMNALLCFNDAGMLGALSVFKEQGKTDPKKYWLGGVDAIEQTITELQSGTSIVQATAGFLWKTIGVIMGKEMAMALSGQTIPRWRNALPIMVTTATLADWNTKNSSPLDETIWPTFSTPHNVAFDPSKDVGLV